MRQRLGIATALIGDPEVLILDEPRQRVGPGHSRLDDVYIDLALKEAGARLVSVMEKY